MKLVIGCGYLGGRVAQAWVAAGSEVSALTRSGRRADALRQQGIGPLVGDVTRPDTLHLPQADTVLIAVGYDRDSPATRRETYVDGLRNVLSALPPPNRIVYVSSTGVYGQSDGSWVDERSPCEPTREGGIVCLEAERLLSDSEFGDRSVILRLAGIYGPDRVPSLNQAQARLRLNANGFLNLIHVEDAVSAVLAAEQLSEVPAMFVVSDGHPVDRADYYREVLKRFPSAASVETPSELPPPSRGLGSKRVANRRMLTVLGVQPRFPSYHEGLAAIAAGC